MSQDDEKRIFQAAIQIGGEGQRDAYLEQECGLDAALRASVKALLDAHFRDGQFMSRPAVRQESDWVDDEDRVGTSVGPYQLLERIGEGGFGVVYRARQQSVGRDVAVKVLTAGLFSNRAHARFDVERQALAVMDHSNIAEIFDAGTIDGHPFFAMELVEGMPITSHCQQYELSVPEKLLLFQDVCDAVQHAHQKGVIHRDIKPTNVLISHVDGKTTPKVIDFGIAKFASERPGQAITKSFEMLGTPAYMSPEQTLVEMSNVDTRSDVYSLGAILYEMLTGEAPFDDCKLRELPFDEMCQVLRETIPLRPSRRLRCTRDATSREGTGFRSDLDWVVMKCLEKEPQRRYESTGALSRDLQRYLDSAPVQAGPPSPIYRIKRNLVRHRFAVASLLAIVVAVIWALTASFTSVYQIRAEKERNRSLLYFSDMSAAVNAWQVDSDVDRVARLLDRHVPKAGESDLRRFEWYYLRRLVDQSRRSTTLKHNVAIYGMSFSKDSKRLAVAAAQHGAFVWDVGRERPQQTDHLPGAFLAVDYAQSGDFVVCGGFGPRGGAQVWGPSKNSRLNLQGAAKFQSRAEILGIAVSPDSNAFAAVDADGKLTVWDSQFNERFRRRVFGQSTRNQYWNVEYSPDGDVITCGTYSNPSYVFVDAHTGAVLPRLAEGLTRDWCVTFDPISARGFIAAGSVDGEVTIFGSSVKGAKRVHQFRAHKGLVRDVTFSPDGRWLASCGNDGAVQLFDVTSGHRVATLRSHSNWVRKLCFSPNGEFLASLGSDANVKLWRVSDILETRHRFELPKGDYYGVEYLGDDRVALASGSDSVDIFDLRSGRVRRQLKLPKELEASSARIVQLDVSASSRMLVASTVGGEIAAWNADDGTLLWCRSGSQQAAGGVAISRDGTHIISTGRRIQLLDAETGNLDREIDGPSLPTEGIAVSSHGKWLATGCYDSNVRLWSTVSWKMSELKGHRGIGHGLAFSPVQSVLATGAEDGRIFLWRIGEGDASEVTASLLYELDDQPTPAFTLCFSPNGRTLASGNGNAISLLDVKTGKLRAEFRDHDTQIQGIAFSSDGATLISLDRSGLLVVRRADGLPE